MRNERPSFIILGVMRCAQSIRCWHTFFHQHHNPTRTTTITWESDECVNGWRIHHKNGIWNANFCIAIICHRSSSLVGSLWLIVCRPLWVHNVRTIWTARWLWHRHTHTHILYKVLVAVQPHGWNGIDSWVHCKAIKRWIKAILTQ